MMVAIDTLAVAKRLLAAGFTDAQAEAVTLVVREAQDIDLSHLVSKDDLSLFATKDDVRVVKDDIRAVREDLRAGLASARSDLFEARADILKWVVGAIGLQTVAIIGAAAALMRATGH